MIKSCLLGALLVLFLGTASAYTIWKLVSSEFNDGHYYCLYQIQGTSIQKTVVSDVSCLSPLVE